MFECDFQQSGLFESEIDSTESVIIKCTNVVVYDRRFCLFILLSENTGTAIDCRVSIVCVWID